MSIYCSQIYQRKPDLERTLTYDIIAYYVELGHQWPPRVDKLIPQRVSFVPIEKFLPDFFVQVYIFHGGYECVTLYDRWNEIRKKFALYQSPFTCPRYLQHIYHEILLPYERQRKTLEQPPPASCAEWTMSSLSLLGYTLKLVIHCEKEGICWKWGTIVAYHKENKLYKVLLDDGRNVLVHEKQLAQWQLGAFNPYASVVDEITKSCCCQRLRQCTSFSFCDKSFRLVTPSDKEKWLHEKGPVVSILSSTRRVVTEMPWEEEEEESSVLQGDAEDWEELLSNKVVYPQLEKKPTEQQRSDIVRCACGWQVDTGDMVECSVCKTWSHKYCIGVNAREWDKLMESDYKCFMCHPNGVKKGSLAHEVWKAIQSVLSQEQWAEHIRQIRQSECAGFLSSQHRDAYEAIDDTGMGDYHPVLAENPKACSPSSVYQKPSTPKLAYKRKNGGGGSHREKHFRRDSKPAPPPFVRVSEKEQKFLHRLRTFWKSCAQPLDVIPMFRGKPFDFYALYEGVKQRGGFRKVVENKQWPEIWKTMRNYYKESTDHSYQLKRYFEKYLKRFMEEYPMEEDEEEEEEKNPSNETNNSNNKNDDNNGVESTREESLSTTNEK